MNFQNNFQAVLKILGLILVLPFLIVFYSFVWIYRQFVSIIYKIYIGPSAGKILDIQSSLFYSQHNNDPYTVQVQFKFNGTLDFQLFRDMFQTKVIEAKDSYGRLIYPELTQSVRPWLGYYFWVADKSFDINEHLVYEDFDCEAGLPKDDDYCEKLALQVNDTILAGDKSPWLITIVNGINYEPNVGKGGDGGESFIVFKFAHYLGDGLSIFQLIAKCADESNVKIYQPKLPNKCESYMKYFCGPFKKIVDASKNSTDDCKSDELWNSLHSKKVDHSESRQTTIKRLRRLVLSKQLPTENVTLLAASLDVSFSSVLLCTFQKGILAYLDNCKVDKPDQWKMAFTIPAPTRGTGLGNRVYLLNETMPTKKDEDFHSQIKSYHERLTEYKNSSAGFTHALLLMLTGMLPSQLRGKYNKGVKIFATNTRYFTDIFYSIFPGPNSELHMLGKRVTEMNYFVKSQVTAGLTFYVFVFNGKMQFWLAAWNDLFTNQQRKELMEYIQTEFTNLDLVNSKC